MLTTFSWKQAGFQKLNKKTSLSLCCTKILMSIRCHFKDQLRSEAINNFPRMSSKNEWKWLQCSVCSHVWGKTSNEVHSQVVQYIAAPINPIFRCPHLLLRQEFLPYFWVFFLFYVYVKKVCLWLYDVKYILARILMGEAQMM